MATPAVDKPLIRLGRHYRDFKHNPPPGLVWRKFGAGYTLDKIAAEYGISRSDLAWDNWFTTQDLQINYYLREYVGCRDYDPATGSYTFSQAEPGQVLVPATRPSSKGVPVKAVAAVRNGDATHDSSLQVYVLEWLPNGLYQNVSGKWLYVFSGTGGLDFGYVPPPPAKTGTSAPTEPGSAFTLDFPGVFPIKARPNKLEYEILITDDDDSSTSLVTAGLLSDRKNAKPTDYKAGSNWYALSDPTILGQSLTKGRHTRTTHTLRDTRTVPIDLPGDKRYYFLLSPVQLGPKALTFAMANPKGLTPLLKPPGGGDAQGAPSTASGQEKDIYFGPTPDDFKNGFRALPVIDPYAWAERLAGSEYVTALDKYTEWFKTTSGTREVLLRQLHDETGGWTLEHFAVARLLKSVNDGYPKLEKELQDAGKWKENLGKWETALVQREAEINARMHYSQARLITWLQGPGHGIIETAILSDTTADSSQDALDVALGIQHWAFCTEHLIALEPGVLYLRELFGRSGSVPADVVLKNLSFKSTELTISKTVAAALRLAPQGMLQFVAHKNFVSPPPPIASSGTRQDYRMKLLDYEVARLTKLVGLLNDHNLLPIKLQVVKLPSASLSGPDKTQVMVTAATAFVDTVDKGLGFVAHKEWLSDKHPTFKKVIFTIRAFTLALSVFSLYNIVTTARYDYQQHQMTVGSQDYMQAVAGVTVAVQDALAEFAAHYTKLGWKKYFPQLESEMAITSRVGLGFAGLNAVAMIVSGILTVISLSSSRDTALSRGDYTAAAWYGIGAVGGMTMVFGGASVVFGLALMQFGAGASVSGIGITVGVVLFFIGGLLASIGSILGAWLSDNDFQVFARKCFLGKQGLEEPRFAIRAFGEVVPADPPAWSYALESGTDTWPIEKQLQALYNLISQFELRTSTKELDGGKALFHGSVLCGITPGLFLPGSTIEIALEYGDEGERQTAVTIEWNPADRDNTRPIVGRKENGLFKGESVLVAVIEEKDAVKQIVVSVDNVNYDSSLGDLVTTVSIRNSIGNSIRKSRTDKNVVRARKRVIRRNSYGVLLEESGPVISALFK